jgi:hypothetical protein
LLPGKNMLSINFTNPQAVAACTARLRVKDGAFQAVLGTGTLDRVLWQQENAVAMSGGVMCSTSHGSAGPVHLRSSGCRLFPKKQRHRLAKL